MKYFDNFTSNTVAGSGNQLFFTMDEGEVRTGRVFYKISAGGRYNYSLLFTNITDSTFSDGMVSHKNYVCDQWQIHSARIGKCKTINNSKTVSELIVSDTDETADIYVFGMTDVTFGGMREKTVMPCEFFTTDPVEMEFEKGEYLCLEMTFSGTVIPYHEETLLPVFVSDGCKWNYSKLMPFASMVGCDREINGCRIGYLGDSITQGIGTPPNSYEHWNALVSEKTGDEYSFWNLGLGYGRAEDAASDSVWLFKAKQNDIVFVCFGVNDILRVKREEDIKRSLETIVDVLKKSGCRVILQTVPPFDYSEEKIQMWKNINEFILNTLSKKVDFVFDNVPYLGKGGEESHMALYGGHPDSEGCRVWAEALYDAVKDIIKKTEQL